MLSPSWFFIGCRYVERGSVGAWGFMVVRGSVRGRPFDNNRVRCRSRGGVPWRRGLG